MKERKNINTETYWDGKYSRNYWSNPNNLVKGAHKPLYEKVVDIIFEVRHDYIVDLGAGIGPVPFLLSKRGFDFNKRIYICVDQSTVGLDRAKKFSPSVKVLPAKVDEPITQLEKSKADLVICCEVLEHLTNPINALKNAYELVSDTGLVVVSVPHGISKHQEHVHWSIRQDLLERFHEAVGLNVYGVTIADRWRVVKSRRMWRKKNVEHPTVQKADLCISD